MSTTVSASAPSSSPSSQAFHFPSTLPRKDQPNAHPYAILTSSTAILSRCNSTTAHPSVGPHHYVPVSPSPTSPHHSPTKPSRHRYSRSLTSDQPPSLPRPPGAESNDEEDNTPTKHGHRVESLPSSAGPPLQNLVLPDDPKSWTPSQLSMYLSATLRPDPNLVGKNIAKFVNEQGITGKTFLRLSEDDLLQFGINQHYRSTLLATSRGLRQRILRGRIWGLDTPPPNEDGHGNVTFPSTASSNGKEAPRVRSRHSSLDHGRVKDLVHSLERSSPTRSGSAAYASDDSDNGDFSAKSLKRMSMSNESFASNHHHHHHHHQPATPSPSKSNRSLPPRGSVNDLFNPSVDLDTAVQAEEDDNTTIKIAAKRGANGREPRMLPFPPNQAPMLAPMHTGSNFPLPLSPEHTGTAYNHLHTADYEMGFRSRNSRSPYSQVFVVRHNPASPSNTLHVDEASSKRLLPFPPVTGETHLHHPKPRRLVGNIDGDPSVSDPGSPDVNGHEINGDLTTPGTEGYDTVLGSQNETEDVESHSTVSVSGDLEEPTVQELVASEPTSKPISGVEAWELDLGETVKRIGGDVDNSDFKRGAEIGRKAGNHPTAPRGARGITDASKRGHILGLFELPRGDVKSSDELDKGPERGDEEETRMEESEKEKEIRSRDHHLFHMEESVAERERVVSEREQVVSQKERVVAERERSIQRWEIEVERREGAVSVQERGLSDRQVLDAERWSAKQKEMQELVVKAEEHQRLLQAKQETLEDQELNIATREERIRGREVELRLWEKQIEAKEEELNEKINAAAAAALAVSESTWPIPVNLLRKCWRMLGMNVSTTTTDSIASDPHQTNARRIRHDILFGPSRSGGYLVLMSIGVCVVALGVLGKIRRRPG